MKIPRPYPGTRARIIGPLHVKGMNVWRVHPILDGGFLGEQYGPDCFSLEEASVRSKDLVTGRAMYFNGTRLVRQAIGGAR